MMATAPTDRLTSASVIPEPVSASTVAVIKTDNRKEEGKAEFADNREDFRVHAERKRTDFADVTENQRADQNASCRFEADIAERAHVYFD